MILFIETLRLLSVLFLTCNTLQSQRSSFLEYLIMDEIGFQKVNLQLTLELQGVTGKEIWDKGLLSALVL